MTTYFQATALAVFSHVVFVVCLAARLEAAPQQPIDVPAVSLERIREGLEKTPVLKLDVHLQRPVAIFRTSVEQRVYMLAFEEQLRKELSLSLLQRQSADWASKCCGLNLSQLTKGVQRALQRRNARKIREQVARELAEVEAAWKKQLPD